MKKLTIIALSILASAASFSAHAKDATGKPAKVFFVSPKDGAIVSSPVKVQFGLEGMKLRPAGEDALDKTSGHHHLIVDGAPFAKGQVIPKDDKNIHFGKAQAETEVTLTPGKHKLTLQFADGAHLSYGPEQSATIEITVKQ